MSDKTLRLLEKEQKNNPSPHNTRKLYHYLFRLGRDEEAIALRNSMGYVEIVKSLPTPTTEQTKRFIEYVAKAHSWYKHLDQNEGTPFYVFLDPHVMMYDNGEEVTKEDRTIHYNQMPTAEYREKFGYWTYTTGMDEEDGLSTHVAGHIIPKELHCSAEMTAHFYGCRFTKEVAPPRSKNTLRYRKEGVPTDSDTVEEELIEIYHYNERLNYAKGKRQLRELFAAAQEFLSKLDEVYNATL